MTPWYCPHWIRIYILSTYYMPHIIWASFIYTMYKQHIYTLNIYIINNLFVYKLKYEGIMFWVSVGTWQLYAVSRDISELDSAKFQLLFHVYAVNNYKSFIYMWSCDMTSIYIYLCVYEIKLIIIHLENKYIHQIDFSCRDKYYQTNTRCGICSRRHL